MTSEKVDGRGEKEAALSLLERHIRPNDRVLIIGPNSSPVLDPSALFISAHMANGKGRLTLLDNKSPTFQAITQKRIASLRGRGREPAESLRRMNAKLKDALWHEQMENPAALGDPFAYSRMLRSFKRAGFPLMPPKILISDARNIDLPDNSVDVVFEHGSLPWIDDVESALHQYLRVVRPGGKIILFTSDRAEYDKSALHNALAPHLGKGAPLQKENGPYKAIAKVTEHKFFPAFNALPWVQATEGKVDFKKLNNAALMMFDLISKNDFVMAPLGGVFNCSHGFVIEKKAKGE